MCAGLWHSQAHWAASSLHPSMLAAPSIIYTLQCTHGFQTHYKSRDYFLKPDATATATETPKYTPGVCTVDTCTSEPRSALLQPHQLLCDGSVNLRRSNPSIRLTTSNHAAQRWSSFSTLTICVCGPTFILTSAFAATFNGFSTEAHMHAKQKLSLTISTTLFDH